MATARRATLREGDDGLWRFKVQGHNWRTLDYSNIGAKRATVEAIIARRYGPDLEIVVIPA